jgi:hypothetical protein
MNKNILIILIFTFLAFAITVSASINFIEVINHETKECGYSTILGNYSLGNEGFTKLVFTSGWQPAGNFANYREWGEYCISMGYRWTREDIPYKIVLTPPVVITVGLVIAGIIFLIIIQCKSRKNKRKSRIK